MDYEDIKNPNDLYLFTRNNIKYGFINKDNKVLLRYNTFEQYYMEELFRNYKFQSPQELLISKCGICYDQNELMRDWLNTHGYNVKTYYTSLRNHSLLVYYVNNKYYWIETTFKPIRGIHTFSSLDALFEYYISTQSDEDKNLSIYEYENMNYGCDIYDFISQAKNSKLVLKK